MDIEPNRLKKKERISELKDGVEVLFSSPIRSLLAFIPVRIFQQMVLESNCYALQVIESGGEAGNALISGARWAHPLSLKELMSFFGILIKMVLRPTPGQDYTRCWDDNMWHPYTAAMPLQRFQQIRAVLHLRNNNGMAGSNDSLYKIRPLLNCIKGTFSAYMEVGSDLALDEASVAAQSKYGAFLIFITQQSPQASITCGST